MANRFNWENVDRIEPQDMVGADWEKIKEATEESYWVVPINTDNPVFNFNYRVSDVAQSGKVHYSRR